MTKPVSLLRALLLFILALCIPVLAHAAKEATKVALPAVAATSASQGDVYILSGGFGVFSTGLKQLQSKLKQNGVAATIMSYQAWRSTAKKIVANRDKYGPRPVVIIGHSLGADNTVLIANELKKKGVPVDLIVSYASTAPQVVPSNVRNVLNYYFKSGGWGGLFTGAGDFTGALDNRDMSTHTGMSHFNVDDDPGLRDEVVRNVVRFFRPAA